MGRKPRLGSQTGCFHVVARGNNHREVFGSESDFLVYQHLLRKYKARHPVDIHHYCLMGNHVHLVLRAEQVKELGQFMHGIQRSYFLYQKGREELAGHLWQGRYGCFPIEDEPYLLECGRYVERNPVQAGLVLEPGEYRWSSYRFYAFGVADPLVTVSPMYAQFGLTLEQRRISYQRYVEITRASEVLKSVPGT